MNTKRQSDHQVIQEIIDYYEVQRVMKAYAEQGEYYDTQANLGDVRTISGTQLEICYKILDGKRYWSTIEFR